MPSLRRSKKKIDEERRKKKAMADQKKAIALRTKQAEAARKAMIAKKAGKEPEPDDAEEEPAADEEEEEVETPELTEEEKELKYRKMPCPDISSSALSASFASFALPTSEEGFDEIKYAWDTADKAGTHLKEWISTQKRTQRVESLQPSAWFKEQWTTSQKTILDWRRRQEDFKNPIKRKAALAKKLAEKKERGPGLQGGRTHGN